jgi:hypothetical protein
MLNLHLLLLTTLAGLLSGSCVLAQIAPQREAFVTKLHRLHAERMQMMHSSFVSAVSNPPTSDDAREIEIWLRSNRKSISSFLASQGITLPPGSLAAYDPTSGTLAIRTHLRVHEMLDDLDHEIGRSLPRVVQWRLDIVEAAKPDVLAGTIAKMPKDATALRLALLAKGKLAATLSGEMKSGDRTSTTLGGTREVIVGYQLDAKGQAQAITEPVHQGTRLELDVVDNFHLSLLDLNFSLDHHYGPTLQHLDPKGPAEGDRQLTWESTPRVNLSTATTVAQSSTSLMGVWGLRGIEDKLRASGMMQAAFLTLHIIRNEVAANEKLLGWIKDFGEKIEPTPAAKDPLHNNGEGESMSTRRYRVPQDYISLSLPGPQPPKKREDAPLPTAVPTYERITGVQKVLLDQGVEFPPGSNAYYLPATSELVVHNTAMNLDLVDSFFCNTYRQVFRGVQLVAYIVEAPTEKMLAWQKAEEATVDHRSLWAEMSSHVKEMAALDSKPGTRSHLQFGQDYRCRDAADTENISSKTKNVGLWLEFDAVLGADLRTVETELQVDYDTAMPQPQLHPVKTQPWPTVLTEFYEHKQQTKLSLVSGVPRVVSVWKPAVPAASATNNVMQALVVRAEVWTLDRPH